MRSLASLVHAAPPNDPLGQALRAIIDSSMVVALRDHEGRLVHASRSLGQALGLDGVAPPGDPSQPRAAFEYLPGQRFFDANGHELSRDQLPTHLARVSGMPQRDRLIGYCMRDHEAWVLGDWIPLERGAAGWSVLGVGTLVTDLHRQRVAAERAARRARALLGVAAALAGRTMSRAELAAPLAPAFAEVLPFANVSLMERSGDRFLITLVMHGWGPLQPASWMRVTPEGAALWGALNTHVNQNVSDTDIYGDRVMGEFSPYPRSLVTVSALDRDGRHVATLVATAEAPDAFDGDAVTFVEEAARLVGTGLSPTRAVAAA